MDTETAQVLLAALRDSGLHNSDRLTFAAEVLAAPGDDVALADQLLAKGLITPYMHRKVRINRAYEILFGPYLILDKIGEGGMGKVYRAVKLKTGQLVALKVVRQHLVTNKTVKRRYKKEAAAAAAFDHQNIVKLYDADEVNGRYYLAMEYVDGIDLARLMKEFGRPPTTGLAQYGEACEYIRQAALGLQHAHEKGLVHRDIKPSNLLVFGDRALPGTRGRATLKILDMGLVRSMIDEEDGYSTELTRDGTVVGTPDYMSPEQAKNSSTVDPRADLYSLGCTFYYLLRGRPPFPDGTPIDKLLRHQLDPPPDLSKDRPDVPQSVIAIIMKLLAKKPEDRFDSAADVASALAAVLNGTPMPVRLEATNQPTQSTSFHAPFSFKSDTSAMTPEINPTPVNVELVSKPTAPSVRLRVVATRPPADNKSSGRIAIPQPDNPLSSDTLPSAGPGRIAAPQPASPVVPAAPVVPARAVVVPSGERRSETSTPTSSTPTRRKPKYRKPSSRNEKAETPLILWIAAGVFTMFMLIFAGMIISNLIGKGESSTVPSVQSTQNGSSPKK